MPHYNLIKTAKITGAETALLCARLYLRDGKNYLQQGSFAAGIAALYDAILFGMHYYIAEPSCRGNIDLNSDDLWDHAALYHKLTRAGIFDDPRAFNHLSQIVERALWQGALSFDVNSVLAEVERMLSKLRVIPFNESMLQSESLAVC
jgi:hypothetical protein